jgi:hypothetical protein
MSRLILVKATFDPEAGVWWTDSGDLHGLRIEDATLERLMERLPGAPQDLIEEEGGVPGDVAIEVVAHASTRVRIAQAA